ncbi:MAG: holo-ACP synthase [Patulibacter sp.]
MTVLGLGTDVVDVAAFGDQLADPASGFAGGTFTTSERAAAARRPGPDAVHLAGRFAAKEAFLKAWSSARIGQPPSIAAADLREIEVVADAYGRPSLRLHGAVRDAVAALTGPAPASLLLSISHDGPVATAVVLLQRAAANPAGGDAPALTSEEAL